MSGLIATLTETNNIRDKNLSSMAIAGMAGLGKMTLAKTIFNEDAIGRPLDKKICACVSLESLNSNKTGFKSHVAMLNNLKEKLFGKRHILIVLNDVWNEDDKLWSNFTS